MRQLLAIVVLCLCLRATGEQVLVVEDFSTGKAAAEWTAADNARFEVGEGVLRITYPKYAPGDPAMWPRAGRSIESIPLTRYNGFRIDIENPTHEHQFLQLSFRDVAGSQGQLAYRFAPGQRRRITERFDEARPSGKIDWSGVQLLDIMRTQPPVDMVWIVRRIELFADRPDATMHAQLVATQKKTADALAHAKASKLMPEAQLSPLIARTQQWSDQLEQPKGIFGKMETCRTELTAAFAQVKAMSLRKQSAKSLLVWTVPVGTSFRPDDALLQYKAGATRLSIHSASGQYEDTIVRLTNLSESPREVKLSITGANSALASSLSFRLNKVVKAEDATLIGDALLPLGSEALTLEPSGTTELWLRLDARNHSLPPGKHSAVLQIASSEGLTQVPMEITVRSFDLAKLRQEMQVQMWAEMFAGRSFVVKNHLDQARANLVDYGVNVFNLGPEEIPWPRLTEAGELASPVDYNLHDQRLAFIRGRDDPKVLYFINLDDNNLANWSLRSNLKPESDAWKKGLKLWLTDWTQHLKKLGLGTDDYALYLSDEPGPAELDRYRLVGQIIREIDPGIQIYINSAELYDHPEKDRELMKVTDIWQPDETVGFASDPRLLPTLKSYPNKQLWVYACRAGTRSRSMNAHDYYRLMIWRAMRNGLTGIGYWSYCAAMENEDLWDGTKVPASGCVVLYGNEQGLVSSVRWELIRQSIDDSKYVQLLRQAAAGQNSEALGVKINSLLNERMNEVIEKRDDPEVLARWRVDAGQAIEDAKIRQN